MQGAQLCKVHNYDDDGDEDGNEDEDDDEDETHPNALIPHKNSRALAIVFPNPTQPRDSVCHNREETYTQSSYFGIKCTSNFFYFMQALFLVNPLNRDLLGNSADLVRYEDVWEPEYQ